MKLNHDDIKKTFEDHHKPLLYYANSFVKDMQAAEDIVSKAFLSLLENGADDSIGFLTVATRNEAINHLKHVKRKRQSHRSIAMLPIDYPEIDYSKDIIAAIQQVVDEMPQERKRIIRLLLNDNLSVNEIASAYNLSRDTVRVQKHRGIKEIKEALVGLIDPIKKRQITVNEWSRMGARTRSKILKYS